MIIDLTSWGWPQFKLTDKKFQDFCTTHYSNKLIFLYKENLFLRDALQKAEQREKELQDNFKKLEKECKQRLKQKYLVKSIKTGMWSMREE
jgi:glucosamine 6-phosphate synthetase-like amidotransferase/phosphosugar isomerase protein